MPGGYIPLTVYAKHSTQYRAAAWKQKSLYEKTPSPDFRQSSGGGVSCISRTLKAEKPDAAIMQDGVIVRKLVPLEYWRLMDFDDDDFYRARAALNEQFYGGSDKSASQLYKQAGNSIVVAVIEADAAQLVTERTPKKEEG